MARFIPEGCLLAVLLLGAAGCGENKRPENTVKTSHVMKPGNILSNSSSIAALTPLNAPPAADAAAADQ